MRGLRLLLAGNSGLDQVYLDESLPAAFQEDLAGIEGGIPELESSHAAYSVQGTVSGWQPTNPQRILRPRDRTGPDGTDVTVDACSSDGFEFRAHRPAELAALIGRAIEACPAH